MQSEKCGMLPLLLGATKNTGAMPMMQWRNFGKSSALPNFTAPHIRSLITDMLQRCRVIDDYSATLYPLNFRFAQISIGVPFKNLFLSSVLVVHLSCEDSIECRQIIRQDPLPTRNFVASQAITDAIREASRLEGVKFRHIDEHSCY
jgi:hypothetical protein